jgi:hypothetical protein
MLAGLTLRTVLAGLGQDSLANAGLLLSRPRFISSGIFYSSGIDSNTLCQSWDASRLGLANSPSLYAGLGTPLGSDQHTPPLLVSLILRRRIRLMAWRSWRHTLEDEDQGGQVQTSIGQAHDHDTIHSTKDGTVLMQAIV